MYEASLRRWATEQAMFANAHFRGAEDEPFEAEQWLGRPKAKAKVHPAFQLALLDQAMNVIPEWAQKMKDARKQ